MTHPQLKHPPWTLMHACMLSHFSCAQLFVILWTVACQALLSMGLFRQEFWNGLPRSPGDLPDSGIKPASLKSPVLASGFFATRIHEKDVTCQLSD